MRIRFVLVPHMQVNMRLPWLLGRLRKLLPLIVLAILLFMFYSMSSHPTPKTVPSLPSPPTPASLVNHWIIVSISHGDICSSLASEFFHWTILLVSVKTVPKHGHSRCIFLSDDDLSLMSQRYSVESLKPIAAAYIYAISHGAEIIYTPSPDADLSSLQKPPNPLLSRNYWGLVFSANASFDAALHFGCKSDRWRNGSSYLLSRNYIPAIHTPAVMESSLMEKCPTLEPPVAVSEGSYVDMHLEGSTFTRDAFWALPMNDVLKDEADKTNWSYYVQWLLWKTGRSVRVHWDGVSRKTVTDQYVNITPDYDVTLRECYSTGFESCAIAVASKLSAKVNLKPALEEWFTALKRSAYSFPDIVHSKTSHSISSSSSSSNDTSVLFHPAEFFLPSVLNSRTQKFFMPVANLNISKKLFSETCGRRRQIVLPTRQSFTWEISVDFSRPWHQFHDVLLLIVFNVAHYDVIPYLEILYRSFFPNILYCGPTIPDLKVFPVLEGYRFSFVTHDQRTGDNIPGSLNYECLIKAILMRYQVDGYLVIADDLLLLINQLVHFPRNVVWHLPRSELRIADLTTLRECRLDMCDFYPHWHWWEDYVAEMLKLLRIFRDEQWSSPVVHRCYSELVRLNGAEFRANGGYSDVYYIPSRLAEDFADLAQMFLREKIFLEIAVPTIVRCLELPEDIHALRGKSVWDLDRDQPWKYFVRSQLFEKVYLHPTKWSGLVNDSVPELVSLYCDYVIPFQFDPYARFKM